LNSAKSIGVAPALSTILAPPVKRTTPFVGEIVSHCGLAGHLKIVGILIAQHCKKTKPHFGSIFEKRETGVMKKEKNTAEILGNDDELDDIELSDGECQERTLILKAEPASRKVQLMARGVKEIRCSSCGRIRPIAGAEQSEDGWICDDCLPR
jgi:hypothetical protein